MTPDRCFKSGVTAPAGYRLDPMRLFEKAVLESAPVGALPKQLRILP